MTTPTPSAGVAKLLLISDFPIEEELLQVARQLWAGGTTDAELEFGENRKWCLWPCRVPDNGGQIRQLGEHIYLCTVFLVQRRKIVTQIRQLGCNLELCFYISGFSEYVSLCSATMKFLSDLEIQLSFQPPRQG